MAATTSAPATRIDSRVSRYFPGLIQLALVAFMAFMAQSGFLAAALLVLVAFEFWPVWRRWTWADIMLRITPLLVGTSVMFVIALTPKALTQIVIAVLYGAWRVWRLRMPLVAPIGFRELLVIQALVLEALFLMSAVWYRTPRPVVLMLIWVSCYVLVYQALASRGERAAGVLAASWALVATECAWVFMTWLVSYITPGDYFIVAQPALVLVVLAYCFGNIYVSQRTRSLNRSRFTEYLLIGLVLLWIVIAGTRWGGTI